MANVPTDWKPELEVRVYTLSISEEDHQTLLARHKRESFLDYADARGVLKGDVDLEPYGEPTIEFALLVDDDTPENHAAFLAALADFIYGQPGVH